MCIKGKLVPNLYMLGTEKCGTSTLANLLLSLGIESPGSLTGGKEKEWHFFDKHWRAHREWIIEDVARGWYDALPSCSYTRKGEHPRRFVVGDFTPMNIVYVRYQPEFIIDMGREWNVNLPATLQYLYGSHLSSSLTFVNLMREPASQMQSLWYFKGRPEREKKEFAGFQRGSFPADIEWALDEFEAGRMSTMLKPIFYGRQLQAWMSYYHPRQFMPIPYRYAAYLKTELVCAEILKRVSMPEVQCKTGHFAQKAQQHQEEQQGLPPSLHKRVDEILATEFHFLVKLLHAANQEGSTLVSLNRSASEGEVREWLVTGW